MQRQVIIVEDDPDIARLIQIQLRDIECESRIFESGEVALEMLQSGSHCDLLILDRMLPGADGIEICSRLRQFNTKIPILMLTARSTEYDRVAGLESGADDYLTKPFSFMEMTARVKALFRRCETHNADENPAIQIDLKHFYLNSSNRKVRIYNQAVELTAREFDLLAFFAAHNGQVFNRQQLLESVWGYHHNGYQHTVNTHINRLRNKIERKPDHPEFIRTVWGVGYQFYASQ